MAIAAAVYHIWWLRKTCKFSKIMLTEEQMVKRIFLGNKMEIVGFVPKRITKIDRSICERLGVRKFFVAWL